MLLAIIVLAVGMLMLTPLLSFLSTMLQKGGDEREQRMKVYAAEAAINQVIADLIRGADGVSTTYNTEEPHTGGIFPTFAITTFYTPPPVTVNGYTPTVSLSLPTPSQQKPVEQQDYIDPGVTDPRLANIAGGYGYLMRLYNVKAGTLQINWAYSPAGTARIGIWTGYPLRQEVPYAPGVVDGLPQERPILDTGSSPASVTSVRSAALAIDPATDGSGGVYTIVFYSPGGGSSKTTAPFAPSGGPDDTWIYAKAYKDYVVTATVGGVSVSTYLRQIPGFAEPPAVTDTGGGTYAFTWSTNLIPFITNQVYPYTWLSP